MLNIQIFTLLKLAVLIFLFSILPNQAFSFDGYTQGSFQGIKGGDSLSIVKDKLKGKCSEFKLDSRSIEDPWDEYNCSDYYFLEKKVLVAFTFTDDRLKFVIIRLKDKSMFYKNVFAPKLVSKYGKPSFRTYKNYTSVSFADEKSVSVGIEKSVGINVVYKLLKN